MKSSHILVFGSRGQLGSALVPLLQSSGHRVTAVDRDDVDLADSENISHLLKKINPDIVINAAAYTDVPGAEKEEKLAFAINAMAPETMALFCAEKKMLK